MWYPWTAFCSRSWVGDTIKTNLKGRDVKQRILLLKKLFEGLLRHKVAYVQLQCSDVLKDTNFTSPLDRLQIIITRHPVIDYCTLKMLPTLN